jgi:flavin-binding protein dodecin
MSDHHTYRKVELTGSSKSSIEDAISNGLAECAKTMENLDWFEVMEVRGNIENGKVEHYQVTIKVGCRIQGS